jgi:hypothetical protein
MNPVFGCDRACQRFSGQIFIVTANDFAFGQPKLLFGNADHTFHVGNELTWRRMESVIDLQIQSSKKKFSLYHRDRDEQMSSRLTDKITIWKYCRFHSTIKELGKFLIQQSIVQLRAHLVIKFVLFVGKLCSSTSWRLAALQFSAVGQGFTKPTVTNRDEILNCDAHASIEQKPLDIICERFRMRTFVTFIKIIQKYKSKNTELRLW